MSLLLSQARHKGPYRTQGLGRRGRENRDFRPETGRSFSEGASLAAFRLAFIGRMSKDSSMRTRTNAELFIVESLTLENEKDNWQEGDIIARMLQLAGKKETRYYYIRTSRELKKIIHLFGQSQHRYLHISCHANESDFSTTFDAVQYAELGKMLRPHLRGKRVFVSACEMANKSLAKELFGKSGLLSLIGPRTDIPFDDAAAFWVSFYHLMFKTDECRMTRSHLINRKVTAFAQDRRPPERLSSIYEIDSRKELRKRINQLSELYGVGMRYFAKTDSGFESLPVHRPISAN